MLTSPISTLALAVSLSALTAAAPHNPPYRNSTPPAQAAKYTQAADFSYPNFFDQYTLFNETDPTYGYIEYVDYSVAADKQLIGWVYRAETNSSNAFVSADPNGIAETGRSSVRLISTKTFGVGSLVVLDVLHIPVSDAHGGAGLWPAVWMLGTEGDWPYSGEIDIIEYVNPTRGGNDNFNAMTLHTGPGCTVNDAPSTYLGSLTNANCSFSEEGNLGSNGCSIPAPTNYSVGANNRTFATSGHAFNTQGGGVYVMEWTTTGVSVWLFPRSGVPVDLANGIPTPSTWQQKPLAKFAGQGCDFTKALTPMQLIINVDICGSWAGNVYPGGPEACNTFAKENPKAYREAYFEFGGIKVYGSA